MTDIFGLLKGKPEDSDYENKGVIVQGITGAYGSLHAKQMIAYGTNVVAGVTPGKGGQKFEETDFVCSGESPDGRLVEFIELKNHPFWVATQAHPEFKSRPDRPAPLFRAFVEAALHRAEGRNPQLLQMEEEFSN